MNDELNDFLDKYEKKWSIKISSNRHYDILSYSRKVDKFGIATWFYNSLFTNYSKDEIIFILKVFDLVSHSKDFREASVAKITMATMKGFVNKNNFKAMKDLFVKDGVLIEVPVSGKYFLINNKILNKYKSHKKWK